MKKLTQWSSSPFLRLVATTLLLLSVVALLIFATVTLARSFGNQINSEIVSVVAILSTAIATSISSLMPYFQNSKELELRKQQWNYELRQQEVEVMLKEIERLEGAADDFIARASRLVANDVLMFNSTQFSDLRSEASTSFFVWESTISVYRDGVENATYSTWRDGLLANDKDRIVSSCYQMRNEVAKRTRTTVKQMREEIKQQQEDT